MFFRILGGCSTSNEKYEVKVSVTQYCPTTCDPIIACQSSMSKGCSRQEYWSGLPFPSPGDFPDPRTKPRFPHIVSRLFTVWATRDESMENVKHVTFQQHSSFCFLVFFFPSRTKASTSKQYITNSGVKLWHLISKSSHYNMKKNYIMSVNYLRDTWEWRGGW